jgi:hydrogenase nickel incorporation protein HypA/HybF
MHEMGIARNILDIAVAAAQREGTGKISKISLIAGELRGIEPAQLTFCFGFTARDTIAEGACLDIEIVPARGFCDECQVGFTVKLRHYACPACGSAKIHLKGGDELLVKDIEIE